MLECLGDSSHIQSSPASFDLQSPEGTLNRKSNNRRSVGVSQETGSFGNGSTETQEPGRRHRRSIVGTAEGSYYTPPAELVSSSSNVSGYQPNRRSVIIRPEEVAALQEGRPYVPTAAANAARANFSSDEETDGVADALSALEGKPGSQRSSFTAKIPHRRSISSVDPSSLAEFAARLPSHMQPGTGSAAFQNFGQSLVNNDDSQDRRRFTTAFNSATPNRPTVAGSGTTGPMGRRLSSVSSVKDLDRKDWRLCKFHNEWKRKCNRGREINILPFYEPYGTIDKSNPVIHSFILTILIIHLI